MPMYQLDEAKMLIRSFGRTNWNCLNHRCQNGATCIDGEHTYINTAYLNGLLLSWQDWVCCHLDDACISNPCKMGAQCDTNPVNGKLICNCPSGYKGKTCAEDIDECAIGPNPCENGGSCKNTESSFTCICGLGYTGPFCVVPE
ncbi:hypothetical protein QQF64_032340 [Cirrhinus molitorella]|uniref:EGF-like domain-containing protein n=1 Tax=Cirrhinus molitorella TaxID=172907 RepID=A0ABR3MZP2_9TELE